MYMYIHVDIHTIRKLYNHSYVFWWITPQKNKYHTTLTQQANLYQKKFKYLKKTVKFRVL